MTRALVHGTAASALLAALFVLGSPARAGEAEPYLTHYLAYDAALQAGDVQAAATHGFAAWQAAEQALGDHRLTGILAYNYGRLIVFDSTENAAEPLRRAKALQRAGLAELPTRALRLLLAYTEFATNGFEEEFARDLREALNAVGLENDTLIADVAAMWLALAAADLAAKRYREATESSAKAESAILQANPNASRDLAHAILLGIVASLGRRPTTIDDLETATEQLGRARRLFPPQENLERFDPLLAEVMAWEHASRRALGDRYQARGWAPPDDDSPPAPPVFRHQSDGSLECDDFDWQTRQSPNYPARAVARGYVGTVVLGYRLGEDLRIRNASILAEIPPGERFGEVLLEASSSWRAESLPTGGTDCSFVELVNFGIDYEFVP